MQNASNVSATEQLQLVLCYYYLTCCKCC